MKRKILLAALLLLFISFACNKETLYDDSRILSEKSDNSLSVNSLSLPDKFCGNTLSTDLVTGKDQIDVGNFLVGNDQTNLFLHFSVDGSRKIKSIQLFLGLCDNINGYVNNGGNIPPGQLPIQISSINAVSYTYNVGLDALTNCPCIVAHIDIEVLDAAGRIKQEGAWVRGEAISSKGQAMKLQYCKQECPIDEGCSLSQGYWFAKPDISWPEDGITIGDHNYTREEGLAIWNTTNKGGIPDSKAGFCQVAAIKLSGTVNSSAAVWTDIKVVEDYLKTLEKLNPGYLPSGNAVAKTAAGNIGNWIEAHHCDDTPVE